MLEKWDFERAKTNHSPNIASFQYPNTHRWILPQDFFTWQSMDLYGPLA